MPDHDDGAALNGDTSRQGISTRVRRVVANARREWRVRSRREQIAIYYYHGVIESRADARLERNFHLLSDFRDQLKLFRRVRPLTLSEIAEELRRPAGRRRGGIAITFDDGYANNLLAHELMSDFNLPWTLFVTTAPADRRTTVWNTELALLLLHGDAPCIDVLGRPWVLGARHQRESAFDEMRKILKRLPSTVRIAAMDALRSQFPPGETDRLLARFPSMQMLGWPQIKMLAEQGVEIGSHGVFHELHHNSQHPETRLAELATSKIELEERLGRACRYFAFPNGDVAAESSAEVAAVGYRLALTTEPRFVRSDDDPYLLPRMTSADL